MAGPQPRLRRSSLRDWLLGESSGRFGWEGVVRCPSSVGAALLQVSESVQSMRTERRVVRRMTVTHAIALFVPAS